MNLLVTGGAGYIGSHTARALHQAGHDVWIYDDLSRGHAAAASLAVPGERLIIGRLADQALLERVLREHQIEAVLHFAGVALVGESVVDPAPYYQTNVDGSISLLEAMRSAGVGRIVFSSTTAIYGNPDQSPITEDMPKRPINPYGFSKLVVEHALEDYAEAYRLAYASLRYFNAAGASSTGDLGEDHTPETHLIPIVLDVALGRREAITLFGNDYPTPDGTCVRDYIHVEDLADAHVRALERMDATSRWQINLGTGSGHSVRQVIDACKRVTGLPITERVGDRRPGDPGILVADASRAAAILGWRPRYVNIDETIETAWRWRQAHPRGYPVKGGG